MDKPNPDKVLLSIKNDIEDLARTQSIDPERAHPYFKMFLKND
ncbi:hypothetical protein ACFLRX_02650 [Acidobacteriota bacterium]